MPDFVYLKNMPYYEKGKYLGIIKSIYLKDNTFFLTIYDSWIDKSFEISISKEKLDYLLKSYKLEKLKEVRKRIIIEKNIKRLIHFTRLDNLEQILENGLFARDMADMIFDTRFSDENRYDDFTGYVNTSISFPNYKMFYKKRMENKGDEWVVLSIDPNVIVDNLDTLFFKTNASSLEMQNAFNAHPEYFKSNDALLSLFESESRSNNIPASYPSNPQAEVLVGNFIDESSITKIYISPSIEDKNHALVRSLSKKYNVDYKVSAQAFGPRCDYNSWKRI